MLEKTQFFKNQKRKWLIGVGVFFYSMASFAAPPDFLKKMAGCFEISYRYVGSGKYDYTLLNAVESVELTETKEGGFQLQRYGIIGGQRYKHWGELWVKEGGNKWKQTVTSPSGVARYSCEGELRFDQIRCFSPRASKPVNRDPNPNPDYDFLNRENILQFGDPKVGSTKKGNWVHLQINDKVQLVKDPSSRVGTKEVVVGKEIGWNEYVQVDKAKCAVK